MIETPVIVKHEKGLDARPIALLVQEASQYASKIFIQVDNKKINAKLTGLISAFRYKADEYADVIKMEQKKAKQDAIMQKEKEASDLKKKYFGAKRPF